MITDPVIGSFVWVTTSLAFLAAATALVRALDTRTPTRSAGSAGRPAERADAEPASGVAP